MNLIVTDIEQKIPTFLIPKQLMLYIKTTETCQLNCKHCFTNGKQGKNIFFNPKKVVDWLYRLKETVPEVQYGNIAFHGGEPLLASIEDLNYVYEKGKDLWSNVRWSMTSNLVVNLNWERRRFLSNFPSFATSWDHSIRFETIQQQTLWEKNVKLLAPDHDITVMVTVSKSLIQDISIRDFLEYIGSLGIKYLHIERITPNGNALLNPDIFPSNVELDEWFVRLWNEYSKGIYEFKCLFFDSLLTSLLYNTHSGCRCRECEQKIFTVNADGSIGGCPNDAVSNTYGHIDDSISTLLQSEGRKSCIVKEMDRNPICYTCDVFDICNGDCNQLAFQDDVCAAPKSLMRILRQEPTVKLTRVLGNNLGRE